MGGREAGRRRSDEIGEAWRILNREHMYAK